MWIHIYWILWILYSKNVLCYEFYRVLLPLNNWKTKQMISYYLEQLKWVLQFCHLKPIEDQICFVLQVWVVIENDCLFWLMIKMDNSIWDFPSHCIIFRHVNVSCFPFFVFLDNKVSWFIFDVFANWWMSVNCSLSCISNISHLQMRIYSFWLCMCHKRFVVE